MTHRTKDEWAKMPVHTLGSWSLETAHKAKADLAELFARVEALEAENAALKAREQEGRNYLVSLTGFGSEDPMGFLIASHAKIKSERDELQAGFDLRWKADRRAIKRWQDATGRTMTWPDHADLVVWLLERLDEREWRPIESAPNDQPILAWCDHKADSYVEDTATGRLTTYAAHIHAGLGHYANGIQILMWGGELNDSDDGYIPDWWFVVGSEFECAANPTHWMPLPTPPSTTLTKEPDQ